MQAIDFATLGVALLLSVLLTPLVRRIAIGAGMVAQPKADRWHRKPTALLGGISIGLSVTVTWLVFMRSLPADNAAWFVLAGSLFLGIVGFVDDVRHIKPYQKLICQVMAAALVISAGLTLPWTGSQEFNVAITFFWLVGITNAINLLDNMDGLAAGVSATAAIFLGINLALNGQPQEALLLGILAATLIGFLFYNWNPASVFMGDTGSMFIGFFLASAALLSGSGARSRSFLVVLAAPVLVLFIPIFDTTLVTILRKLAGRPASQGGRDHTSHRLVALGLSESRAVWLLYGLAIASGMLAILVNHLEWSASAVVIIAFVIALSLLGIYLGGVKVYDEAEAQAARMRPAIAFIVDISYKRRLFEVALDLILILLALYGTTSLLEPDSTVNADWAQLSVVSVLVVAQMSSMLATGAYRGIWRYVSIENLFVYAKGIVLGTAASYVVLRFVIQAEGIRAGVFVVDALLLFVMVASSRMTFRLLRYLIPLRPSTNSRRALIYGAGDGGDLLLRELQNNTQIGMTPIGFVDDDALKAGKHIHGLPVHLATPTGLLAVCREQNAQELVVSTSRMTEQRLEELARLCTEGGIILRRMRIQLDLITPTSVEAQNGARRYAHEGDVPSLTEIRKRRDSQPVLSADVNKRRDSKPIRAVTS